MYDITNLPTSVEIGLTGEHAFRTIEIDMSEWMAIMPSGVPSIVHIRPGEGDDDAYIVATTFDSDTNVLSWTVSRSDLGTVEGVGTAQVWLEEVANYTLAKRGLSAMFATIIRDSIGNDSATVPAAQVPFVQQMTQLKTNTVAAALRAEAAQAAAESAASGVSEYTSQAQQHAQNADNYAEVSEAYAKGTVNGVAVGEGETGYQDNSKYYKEQAEAAATAAAGSATAASQQASAAGNSMSQAYQYSQAAATSAQNAASSASAAETSATNALESVAVAEAAKGVAQTSASEAAASAAQAAQTVAGIVDAGDAQVTRVAAQGAAERAAIVEEGEDVLDSIPADYTALGNQVSDLINEKAGIIPCAAAGEYVMVTPDASAPSIDGSIISETSGNKTLYRHGHNMVNQTYSDMVPGYTYTNNGITYTINEDMSVTADGTATATSNINLTSNNSAAHIPLPKGDYILSGCPEGGGSTSYSLRLRAQNIGGGGTTFLREVGNGLAFSVTDSREVGRLYIEIAKGTTVNNLVFKPMIRFASGSDEYTPWGYLGGYASYTVEDSSFSIDGIPGKETIVFSLDGEISINYAADIKAYINSRMLALYKMFEKVAYSDENGQTYLENLHAALFSE